MVSLDIMMDVIPIPKKLVELIKITNKNIFVGYGEPQLYVLKSNCRFIDGDFIMVLKRDYGMCDG